MKGWVPISELAGPCIVYCVQQIDSKYISRENLHRWSDEELEPLQGCHIRSWQHLGQEHLLPWLSNRPKVLQPHLGKHPGFGSLTKEFLLCRLVGGDLCRDGFQVLGQLHVAWMEILEGTEATVLKILHAGDHVTNTALLMRLNLFMRSWQTECQYICDAVVRTGRQAVRRWGEVGRHETLEIFRQWIHQWAGCMKLKESAGGLQRTLNDNTSHCWCHLRK